MQGCVFCQVVTTELQASIVFEDDICIAFLDHRPLFPGHCLLVPRQHFEVLADLPTSLIGSFFKNVQLLSQAVEAAMQAQGTFVAMNNRVSQSVPHLHVHVVPRRKGDGLKGFFWPRHRYRDENEALVVQQAIRSVVISLQNSS